MATAALVGGSSPAPAGAQTPPSVPEPYVGVTPVRVLEPVVGGVGGGPMATGDVRTLTVTGAGGVPATVEAVDLTVTATRQGGNPTARIFVSAGGTSTTVPALTVKSIGSRQIATVTVAPSATGEITVRADAAADVQVDVRGYLAVDAGFTAAVTPATVLDTANGLGGGQLVGGTAREVGIVGIGGVPATGVSAVVVRTLVTPTTQAGVVRVAPAGAPAATGEASRFNSATERVSSAIVALGHEGRIQLTSSADLHAVVVVDGWFDDSRGYTPIVPTTVVDNVLVAGGGSHTAASAAVLPDVGVGAVAVQVVATGTTTVGTFSLRAGTGQETPALSVGGPIANQRGGSVVWTPVRSDGTFDVALSSGMPSTRVTVSVVGWTAAPVGLAADTTLPTASVVSPTPSTSVDASETGSFTMVIAAADPGSGVASVAVTVAGHTTAAREEMVGTGRGWVVEVPAASSGPRDYVVDVVDRAGNVRTITASYTLTAPAEEETVLDPDTTEVDETVGELTAYDSSTGAMVFAGDVTATIRPGQILASDPTPLAPNGYLRVVTGLTRTGTTTTVQSRQAVVTEAVRRASFEIDLPSEGGTANRSLEVDLARSWGPQLSFTANYISGPVTTTLEVAGGVTFAVGLHVALEIDFGWTHLPRVEHFEAVAEASATVSATETVSGEFHKGRTNGDTPLVTVSLPPIPTPIPGVVITPAIELRYDWSVTVSGSLSAEFTTGRRFQVGIVYDGSSWDTITEEGTIGGGFEIAQEASIEFLADLGLAARLNVSVNDTVGLYLEGRVALEISGAASTSNGFECGARLGLTVGVGSDIQIPVLGISIAELAFGDMPLAEIDLFNISCPGGTPVEVPVEGTEPWVGEEEIVSTNADGDPGDRDSSTPVATPGGSTVAFLSRAGNLVPGHTTDATRLYVRSYDTNTMEVIPLGLGGAAPNGTVGLRDISPDGRYLLFDSTATNIVSGVTSGWWRPYVYDRVTDAVEVLVGQPGEPCAQGFTSLGQGRLSDDARFVLFESDAPCVVGDTNGSRDAFVIDRTTDVIERASVDASGGQLPTGGSQSSMSTDGRYVSFVSTTTLIDPTITSPASQRTFRRDRTAGTSEVVSYVDDGVETAFQVAHMDGSGRRFVGSNQTPNVLFCTTAFLVDMGAATTQEIVGGCPTHGGGGWSLDLSANGRYVAFIDSAYQDVGVLDVHTGDRHPCSAAGQHMSENGRWMLGGRGMGVAPDVTVQAVRTRCR